MAFGRAQVYMKKFPVNKYYQYNNKRACSLMRADQKLALKTRLACYVDDFYVVDAGVYYTECGTLWCKNDACLSV